ncbi:uncharacterized protein LOC143296920 [Babylonia areolata]|uniref:uncharacterized protein LOC143296920 n=1 Tax=Babylonia areolata TaxID=304850 RepID=UPI003FD2613F
MTNVFLATLLLTLGIAHGFEWESVQDDLIYACAGSTVTFPWRFKVSDKESVVNVQWTYHGALSSDLVATMVSGGIFVATEGYRARAKHMPTGGLRLGGLAAEDSGNYTVTVHVVGEGEGSSSSSQGGLHGAAAFRSYQRSVYLQVADGLMLRGGQLRAQQQTEAWWDETSRQWFLRLTCGTFTFLGPAPLNITWTTPAGETKSSTGYDSGLFYLSVPTPVLGGNYTCTIPPARFPDVCFKDNDVRDRRAISAILTVDEMKARLSLLEANQKTVREENERLRTNQERLHADNERLVANQTTLQELNERLQEKLKLVEETHMRDMQNVTGFCQDIRTSVQKQLDQWQKEHQSEKNKTRAVVEMSGPCHPSNYTVLDDTRRVVAGVYTGSGDMCDKHLKLGWYRFLLNRENAVIPTTCVPVKNCHTDAPTWVDLQGQPLPLTGQETEARACSHWSANCCNWESPITVRNCGEYYVYKIKPLSACDLSFCAEPQ